MDLIETIITQQARCRSRRMVVLAGDQDWSRKQLSFLQSEQAQKSILWITDHAPANAESITASQSKSVLGKEVDLLIYDAFSGFSPDAFGAVSGTICGGGILFLLIPPLATWPDFFDPEYSRITVFPQAAENMTGRYLSRLTNILRNDQETLLIEQDKALPSISVLENSTSHEKLSPLYRTIDQQQVVEGIIHVAKGHRRRPLVITSDRGRGKSSALGIAAAQLVRKHELTRIVVTAPRRVATQQLFEHASVQLTGATVSRGKIQYDQAIIEFIAPDALLKSDQKANLLLIDEAAGIPTPLLEKLLKQFSRVVFASTIHGYEGSGRGFALRFHQILRQQTPEWKSLHMETPIRWAKNDPLEALCFKMLMLNASPADQAAIKQMVLEKIDRDQLLTNETTLSQIFGLLVNAHYQTSPSDLRYLLDGSNLSIYVFRDKKHGAIFATLLLAEEGGFDQEMTAAINNGERRPHGNLVPETLATHCGLEQAPALRCGRIVRIAVHPDLQNRGLGAEMIKQLADHASSDKLDYLAASFAASAELMPFWRKVNMQAVRIGFKRNASSGAHSLLVICPLNKSGEILLSQARDQFFTQFPHQLSDALRDLEAELIELLMWVDQPCSRVLSSSEKNDLMAFANGQRIYEAIPATLWKWTGYQLMSGKIARLLNPQQKTVLISKVMQKKDWAAVSKLANLAGRKESLKYLRDAVTCLENSVE